MNDDNDAIEFAEYLAANYLLQYRLGVDGSWWYNAGKLYKTKEVYELYRKANKTRKYITESEYKNLAESLDKPVINLLKDGNLPFEKWGENINRLIQKELGLKKTTVYEYENEYKK